MNRFYKDYQIEYDDCGENGLLRLPNLIDLFMETSEGQLTNGPASSQGMQEKGLGWVVTQYEFSFSRLPQAKEKVRLWTEASGYNRFLCYRNFGLEDEAGNDVITVRSQWIVLDLEKRKLLPVNEKLVADLKAPKLTKLPRFQKLRPLDQYDHEQNYRIRYYDIDLNHHVHNSRYLDWIMDSLPRDFLNRHVPASLVIKFDKEIQYGEEVTCQATYAPEELTSSHALTHHGDVMALCEVKWREM